MENTSILKHGLSGTALKLFALIVMTIDHIGMLLLPQYRILRVIGRLAFPIFAYMIAEGCRYTHNKRLYWGRMAALGIAAQIIYYAADRDLTMCIFISFALAIPLIYALHSKKNARSMLLLSAAAFALIVFVTMLLPELIPGFNVDYGFWGVMLPVLISLGNDKRRRLILAAIGIAAVSLSLGGIQIWSLLSLIPLAMYNGTRGRFPMKALFYIYYPAHLAVLYAISMII
ncbi:MAG TPA: hypothetical protein IAA61_11660 [Candidatus Ornithomonoglobus merdipullorum]|uniref:Conjugal transfer protein TraX n=1 Tax=Candidatus Ornithomonoglobus merdipullorum TaxID=2840895 RepID=A0A9D1ME97_9FIRM|nr:hypothetical protein [Candidatus Ornithomonoglobus merdipullorum]